MVEQRVRLDGRGEGAGGITKGVGADQAGGSMILAVELKESSMLDTWSVVRTIPLKNFSFVIWMCLTCVLQAFNTGESS